MEHGFPFGAIARPFVHIPHKEAQRTAQDPVNHWLRVLHIPVVAQGIVVPVPALDLVGKQKYRKSKRQDCCHHGHPPPPDQGAEQPRIKSFRGQSPGRPRYHCFSIPLIPDSQFNQHRRHQPPTDQQGDAEVDHDYLSKFRQPRLPHVGQEEDHNQCRDGSQGRSNEGRKDLPVALLEEVVHHDNGVVHDHPEGHRDAGQCIEVQFDAKIIIGHGGQTQVDHQRAE